MFKHIAYGGVVVAAAVTLSGLGAGGAGASATASRAGQAALTAGQVPAVPGAQLWVQRYDGPGNGGSNARAVAVSPGGDKVFVTGTSYDDSNPDISRADYATVAYNAATGAQLWVQRYTGPGDRDIARSLAVSPSGGTVFVTGTSDGGRYATRDDYATVAYDAATGAQLWVQRHNGTANGNDHAYSVAVSPAGGTVFVTGSRNAPNRHANYATVAYNAATGAQRWVHSYNGPANGNDNAYSVAVSPAGGTVVVTGASAGANGRDYDHGGADYATVAYNAATGAQLWVQRYNGPGNGGDYAASVTVSPGGGRVFVTGRSATRWDSYNGGDMNPDYVTVAYRAPNGVQLWAKRYNGPGNDEDKATSAAVSPTGRAVFVTGSSTGDVPVAGTKSVDYATVAYDPATGTQLWLRRYTGPINYWNYARSVAVSPSGDTVYITGSSAGGAVISYDYATVAYNAATGARLWVNRYNGPLNDDDDPYSVAVSPAGDTVFVTGTSAGAGYDYATVAYSG